MNPPSQPSLSPSANHNAPLQITFTWKQIKAYISTATALSKPIYTVDYSTIKKECILISSSTTNARIGSGTLHIFSINPNFKIHRQNHTGVLKALSRWKTSYTYLSHAFAPPNSPPIPMTWTGNSDFKTWDFVCLDPQQIPIAKVRANYWSLTKAGWIEFLRDREISEEARDEIVVTGLTLMYCMLLRTMSLPAFFGAFFARPGPIKNKDGAVEKSQHSDYKGLAKVGQAVGEVGHGQYTSSQEGGGGGGGGGDAGGSAA
ncbi:MAG: hypothetical protein Q9221_006997 [Calogaya cf. arnoldii]